MPKCTVSGNPPDPEAHSGAPTDEKYPDGQYKDHYVLCKEERAKGFVRPVRVRYKHVGKPGPKYPLLDLTEEQKKKKEIGGTDWIKFEKYPESESPVIGRYWSQEDLDRVDVGCKVVTTMPYACAETYARQPGYYGSTFCCRCGKYLPVGEDGEFVWLDDGTRVGT